jgi:hypothetical protein
MKEIKVKNFVLLAKCEDNELRPVLIENDEEQKEFNNLLKSLTNKYQYLIVDIPLKVKEKNKK